ncbi:MAG: hypothetical protein P4M05_28330 [Bradyrhizobium sp.]|nr:hypothetical protein [Bradyrhizobium sp.]
MGARDIADVTRDLAQLPAVVFFQLFRPPEQRSDGNGIAIESAEAFPLAIASNVQHATCSELF